MNEELIAVLKKKIGTVLTWQDAADIYVQATRVSVLVPQSVIKQIEPQQCGDFTFARERMEDIIGEMKPLHEAHWNETETERHGLELNPDYETFIRYERAGRYILFTLRDAAGVLVGNCAMYLDTSTHTQTLLATEDTLFLLPEARKGRTAMHFVSFIERSLHQLGAKEIHITVKKVNKAEKFFRFLGYVHAENGFLKMLG